MSKRKCVQESLMHKKTEYTPYNTELTGELQARLEGELGLGEGSFFSWAGNHIEKCSFEKGEFIEPEIYKDEYGVVWDRSGVDKDIGIIHDYAFEKPDISLYEFPKVDKKEISKKCEKFFEDDRDTYKFAKIGTTLFEQAWSLRGFQSLLMDFLLEEDFAQELFERIVDRHIEVLNIALEYDFDGVYFGDDYGQQSGMLMSPEIWRKFLKPQLKVLFDKAKTKGKAVCLHSCGDISKVLPDLIEIGLDIYQTVQPEIYDLRKLKGDFGDDLSFFGAISTQRDLPFKKPHEIKRIVNETMGMLGESGGYIAAPTHKITGDTPVENVVALVEAFKEQ